MALLKPSAPARPRRAPGRLRRKRGGVARAIVFGMLLLGFGLARAALARELEEYRVKAVFLFNFTQFVDWPASDFDNPNQPISICILGDDPFGAYLDQTVRDEKVAGRSLVVRRLRQAQDSAGCQVLFVGESDPARAQALLERSRRRGMLTVGDARDFAEHGGMVALVTEGNHVHLRINLAAAKAAGLSLSSKLLRVAELVNPPAGAP